MNPLYQMNQAMDWLEKQLPEEADYGQMARIAGCTEYHFRRMFSYLAGLPLGEYVRSRKLALAGELLQNGGKAIDCAVLLGYESPDAFARAFQRMHGISPAEAKRGGAPLKAYPPLSFQLTIRGGMKMEYRIEQKDAFRIVGFKKRITAQFKGINRQMDTVVEKLAPERIKELKSLCNAEPSGMLSVSANYEERKEEDRALDQYIGVATTKAAPIGYDVLEVAAYQWAVFTVTGPFPEAMQDTWARIFAEWMPGSEYQFAGGPELLWHGGQDMTQPDYRCEIWVSVTGH